MTNKEAVISEIHGNENNIPDTLIEKAFLDVWVNGSVLDAQEVYTGENKTHVGLISISILETLLSKPSSISEGGYSISYDKQGIEILLGVLYRKYDIKIPGKNTLRFHSL